MYYIVLVAVALPAPLAVCICCVHKLMVKVEAVLAPLFLPRPIGSFWCDVSRSSRQIKRRSSVSARSNETWGDEKVVVEFRQILSDLILRHLVGGVGVVGRFPDSIAILGAS